jgi:radical SAM superfamily enzyme YgiQ (UPF0313 family)
MNTPFILLVNPWITDFAAFDYWAKPLGLLLLGSLLRAGGCGIAFIDCVDRHDDLTNQHPDMISGVERKYGTGKYPKIRLSKPGAYAEIPRHYYRHGIHAESLRQKLKAIGKPDLIWMTSIMTYWYPGIQQTIAVIREFFPDTPIWLGGVYAQLCLQHARETSGATEVVTLPLEELPEKIAAATGFSLRNRHEWVHFELLPPPALDLLSKLTYAPLLTGWGCMFKCPYCASGILQPTWQRRTAHAIFKEICKWHREYGVVDFAFYDDALLIQPENSLEPALRRICQELPRLRFHTPNAVHIYALTSERCQLLHACGFTTMRLGLETTQREKQADWGGKVKTEMFVTAVEHLLGAGFLSDQIGVYLLSGLPGQSPGEVAEAIQVVRETGAQPYIAQYSPIPGTKIWKSAVAVSQFDLAAEPLYHNNTFFACRRPDFSYEDLLQLKDLARQARRHNQ